MIAPIAAGGGVVAGISAALIAMYQISDCLAFKSKKGECDSVVSMGVPAMVAGFGAVASTMGGLWTYNKKLREPGERSRKRDENGRFTL